MPLAAQPELRWVAGAENVPARVVVEAGGFTREQLETLRASGEDAAWWSRLLRVRVLPAEGGAPDDDQPGMLGQASWRDDTLCFTPRFPLEAGMAYQAELRLDALPAGDAKVVALTARHQVPALPSQPSTRMLAVHPSAPELPANLLKFYLHFSAPMSRGCSRQHARLLDASGGVVELPFLELDEELWSPDQTRLTLLLDPGRIKRGLLPLDEAGPALLQGQDYTIEINAEWPDAKDRKLVAGFRHSFRVGAADTRPPDPARWQVEAPASGTRAALAIRFDEPMDHALARRLMTVESEAGRKIAGKIELADHDQRWTFLPDEPWRAEPHRMVIDTLIEDLAGNQIGRVFDVDTFEKVLLPQSTHAVLAFEPR